MNGIVVGRLPTGRLGQAIAVVLLLLLLSALWAAVASPLLAWHAERADLIERRATLARRMSNIVADLPRLEQQATAGVQAGPQRIALLQGGSDAVAGAALQQVIQESASKAGARLSSLEALSPQQMGGYRQVAVRVAVSASWGALVELIDTVEEGSPQMLVDDLQIHGAYGFIREANAPLTASMVVMGFRAAGSSP